MFVYVVKMTLRNEWIVLKNLKTRVSFMGNSTIAIDAQNIEMGKKSPV